MRISVFGTGYVGTVSSGCFASLGHHLIGVDVSAEKVAMLNRGIAPIVEAEIGALIGDAFAAGALRATTDVAAAVADSDLSLISVGTPSGPDGAVSLDAVDEVVGAIGEAIARKDGAHAVAMRSTVPPGTAEERVIPLLESRSGRRLGAGLAYYSNPEFLREGTAVRDFHAPPYTLIGAAPGDDAAILRALYAPIDAPVHVVPYRIAESVKYLSNAYHAVKLAFANEAGAVLAAYGVDAPAAFRLFCADRVLNISPAYLRPGFAFGGSCLPKEVRSFLALAGRRAVPVPLLGAVLPGNDAIIEHAFRAVTAHGRRPVALFGLAFKPGTDDLRESPFVRLAERLIGRGYALRIFDRSVKLASLLGGNRAYIEREIPHLERLMAADPAEALAGAGLVVVGHIGAEDRAALLAGLDRQTVIDLADIAALRAHPGIAYQGLCW
ncbi:MAG: UDP-glucose/GDP-mannose dehydrogenase family protein [Rhodospirillales bacterium]|nr:UDP-glucose/GDP-mannose dehydrogenase family protein [Rhodospirillales bacterium]